MRLHYLLLVVACCVNVCSLAPLVHSQTPPLPPESSLPHSRQPSVLPAESELPQLSESHPDTDDSKPKEKKLPPENALPGLVPAEPDQAKADFSENFDQRPHLRLDYPGHTGMIRDLLYLSKPDRLVSVGEDKDVHVWRRDPRKKLIWIHDRTIRWQVIRGDAGRIYCVAGRDNQIAIAGNGAMGGHGEIIVLDVLTGELVRPLMQNTTGHLEVVGGLTWTPEQKEPNLSALASVDLRGQIMYWKPDPHTGLWNGAVIQQDDSHSLGKDIAQRLIPYRSFVPITFRDQEELLFAKFDHFDENQENIATWQLVRWDTFSGKQQIIEHARLSGNVRILQSSHNGRFVAAAGSGSTIHLLCFDDKRNIQRVSRINTAAQPSFVDFFELAIPDAAGKKTPMMIVGTEIAGLLNNRPVARLQVWNVESETAKLVSETLVEGILASGHYDPKAHCVIVATGSTIFVYSMDENGKILQEPVQKMDAAARPIVQTVFAKDKPYRVAFKRRGSTFQEKQNQPFDGVFDLSRITLERQAQPAPSDFLPAQRLRDPFTVRAKSDTTEMKFELVRLVGDNAPESNGTLPLSVEVHGAPTTIATTNRDNEHEAVIIGTSGRSNIYLYSTRKSDPPRLIRQFRGHTSSVQSLSVSGDGKYLVSGSADSTIMVWNLQDMFSCSESINRWGINFEIDDGKVIAQEVREDGPLYFRGIRSGDRLLGISWATQAGEITETSDPQSIIDQLTSVPFDTLVAFRFSRMGRPVVPLQSFPAWQPLATLLVDTDREWMFWTPAGFYDASFNGHQRFGWQINRGVERLPDYFRAAQFRETLERPRVMKRLLEFGSLPLAMRRSLSQTEPPPGESAIVNQYRTQPRIMIISPQASQTIHGDQLEVKLKIDIPLGAQLSSPKGFVSGIPATSVTQLEKQNEIVGNTVTQYFQMSFNLPDDEELFLEVMAATDSRATDRQTMVLTHDAVVKKSRLPRLHLLAIGVSEYRDPQIQSLDFPANATEAVADAFRAHSGSLYRVTSERLVNADAVRSLWKIYAQDAFERLRETVSPNDLVVMYLCGHGIRDRRTNQWYFVTADAQFQDLMNDQFDDCLSFDDLSLLSSLPCRKLAILDSCHSGAVQPVMQNDDLKTAMRRLQNDVVITLTASEGDEEAAEERETGLGRFTKRLVEALRGNSDQNSDRKVTLRELIDYVVRNVGSDSAGEGDDQHPTASPAYLTDRLEFPVTRSSDPSDMR